MKQETLKEAAAYYAHNYFNMHEINNYKALKQGFENGAKWQQERSYSEEEVYNLLLKYQNECSYVNNGNGLKHWFNQFKKKP